MVEILSQGVLTYHHNVHLIVLRCTLNILQFCQLYLSKAGGGVHNDYSKKEMKKLSFPPLEGRDLTFSG